MVDILWFVGALLYGVLTGFLTGVSLTPGTTKSVGGACSGWGLSDGVNRGQGCGCCWRIPVRFLLGILCGTWGWNLVPTQISY